MLGRHVKNVVRSAVNGDIREIQRLGVDIAVHRLGEQLAELIAVHVRRSEDSLVCVLAGSGNIVVKRGHVYLCNHHPRDSAAKTTEQGHHGSK